MKEQLWKNILSVREKSPLVHSITNYVVMNNTANALLAAGASPIMAHAHAEMKDMVSIVGALVVNIGTLDEYFVKSMHMAIEQANAMKKPWVLDPVGAGATPYRNDVLIELLSLKPTVIRGNASEILALASRHAAVTKGVDSTHHSTDAVDAAVTLNQHYGSVVCISGSTDIVIDKGRMLMISNGHKMMTRVTGLGCTATALTGAMIAVRPEDAFEATASAMALLGIAGELAAEKSEGPGSLQMHLLDALYAINQKQFTNMLKLDIA